ncbi:class I SAM-dependent methyltransferase [Nesterenkonia sp. F]|uniref:class I SAM-dependent methyltransferase n=1 Tax=Nesterenkonia sp. F TaxID=795955 RepID=UPI000255CCCC|nr:class I SAM-dependent methyltransferase [Nesterenkonia sp. F]
MTEETPDGGTAAAASDDAVVAPLPEHAWTEDPDYVRVYDVENAGGWDHDFYAELIGELVGVPVDDGARSGGPGAADDGDDPRTPHVADIGCGTGVLGLRLAAAGIRVTGVDPSAAMIAAAEARTAGSDLDELVTWHHGFADRLPTASVDVVLMEGHVAQYFLERSAWDEVLAHAHRALVPGGALTFESRNPEGLELDVWDEEHTRETQEHPDGGTFDSWIELVSVVGEQDDGPLVTHRGHMVLPDGRHVTTEETLRFRPLEVLRGSLEQAGFVIEQLWGDWDREELDADSPEIIVLARKR